MTAKEFYMCGRVLATLAYAKRGGPQPKEDGKRARWENFEFGPYPARVGIVGEIQRKHFSWHPLIFEVDFGSHRISAMSTPIRDTNDVKTGEVIDWVEVPSDADLVAISLIHGNIFG